MLGAVYRTYGVPALWTPVDGGPTSTPTVRHEVEDQDLRFGEGRAMGRRNVLFVRVSEVAMPAAGDHVDIPAGSFSLKGEPALEPGGLEWRCPAVGA